MKIRVLAASIILTALSIHAADAKGLLGAVVRGAAFGTGAAVASHAVREYTADRRPSSQPSGQQAPIQPTSTPAKNPF